MPLLRHPSIALPAAAWADTFLAAFVFAIVLAHVATSYFSREFPVQNEYYLWWFPTELPVFLLGVVAYYLWKKLMHDGSHVPAFARLLSLASLSVAAAILGFVHHHLPLAHGVTAMAVLIGLMLHPWHLFVNRATRFLGKISYSMYLFHFFVIVGLRTALASSATPGGYLWNERLFGRPPAFAAYFGVLLCISMPICTVSWLFLEEPFIALGRRLITRLDRGRTETQLAINPHELLSRSNTADNQF